jgi:hypothetical protein
LRPFGLVLHHDGRWSHESDPLLHRKLRAAFDKGVRFLPDEDCFVVQLGHFRGQIEVEEAGFFVREFEPGSGRIRLSDQSWETLEPASLQPSHLDGALLCRIKRDLSAPGLLARFDHSAQADLLLAVEETADGAFQLRVGGNLQAFPGL